jgi:hypothetical protein
MNIYLLVLLLRDLCCYRYFFLCDICLWYQIWEYCILKVLQNIYIFLNMRKFKLGKPLFRIIWGFWTLSIIRYSRRHYCYLRDSFIQETDVILLICHESILYVVAQFLSYSELYFWTVWEIPEQTDYTFKHTGTEWNYPTHTEHPDHTLSLSVVCEQPARASFQFLKFLFGKRRLCESVYVISLFGTA